MTENFLILWMMNVVM